jgi:hypothetical protein
LAEDGRLERTVHLTGEVLSLVVLAIAAWYYIDPTAEPKELLEETWQRAKRWLLERAARSQSFRRTLESIRDLPEREAT